jgi:hypothetical protein
VKVVCRLDVGFALKAFVHNTVLYTLFLLLFWRINTHPQPLQTRLSHRRPQRGRSVSWKQRTNPLTTSKLPLLRPRPYIVADCTILQRAKSAAKQCLHIPVGGDEIAPGVSVTHELANSHHPASEPEPEPRVASSKFRVSRLEGGKRNDKRVSGWVYFCCGRVEDWEEEGDQDNE